MVEIDNPVMVAALELLTAREGGESDKPTIRRWAEERKPQIYTDFFHLARIMIVLNRLRNQF